MRTYFTKVIFFEIKTFTRRGVLYSLNQFRNSKNQLKDIKAFLL